MWRRGCGPLRSSAPANCGGNAHFVRCDVTERASVEPAIAETIACYGKLDILHNNAGGSTLQDGLVTEAPEEEFWRVIELDLYGTSCAARSPSRPVADQ
jgi:NAD(P)-dependent dehydrogenase (short-subunit alcohol dehydrogenase family)